MISFPLVSILLPVRNEAKSIKNCLQSILDQDYPKNRMQIIVADGCSEDKTREIVQCFIDEYPNIILVHNPGEIVPTGLNAALKEACGEYIIRVDGHTKISNDYVKECVLALERSGADNVGGKMSAEGNTNFGGAVTIATSSSFGVGNALFHYSDKEEWVDTVYLGAWPRNVFTRIGLFDEEMVRDQDDEFNYRLRANGGRILLSPNIKSKYTVRNTPKALWKQYYQYGYWKVRVLQKHPLQMSYRQFVPSLFVLSLIIFSLFSLINPWGVFLLAIVGGTYLLSNLLAIILFCKSAGMEIHISLTNDIFNPSPQLWIWVSAWIIELLEPMGR